jgi:hypothetical protein
MVCLLFKGITEITGRVAGLADHAKEATRDALNPL